MSSEWLGWSHGWQISMPGDVPRSEVVMWLPGQSNHQGSQVNGSWCSARLPGRLHIPGTIHVCSMESGKILKMSGCCLVVMLDMSWKCHEMSGSPWTFSYFTPSPSHCHHCLSFFAPIPRGKDWVCPSCSHQLEPIMCIISFIKWIWVCRLHSSYWAL